MFLKILNEDSEINSSLYLINLKLKKLYIYAVTNVRFKKILIIFSVNVAYREN